MNAPPFIRAEDAESVLDWTELANALEAGHRRPRAILDDTLLQRGERALLSRAAWIEGLGAGVKTVAVFPDNARRNPPLPTIHGAFVLLDDDSGRPLALMDATLLNRWKTAADSALGARILARTDSKNLLIIGAGKTARALAEAYRAVLPSLRRIQIWNRTHAHAEKLAAELSATPGPAVEWTADLPAAVAEADIVSAATFAESPILRGEWVQAGTHADLVGSFTPHMREADDALLRRARIFADLRQTALETGELALPLAKGVIGESDLLGDLYDLCAGAAGRTGAEDITVYKNGGGAHLDLMTAEMTLRKFTETRGK